jgi:microsomal dipeptidase-like Zn-dependent dipeptidase
MKLKTAAKGYSDREIGKVMGENVLRVARRVWGG